MPEYVVINKKIKLSEARKDVCEDGVTPYVGGLDQISEWALVFAMQSFKNKDVVHIDEFSRHLSEAIAQDTLDRLCEKGLVKMYWNQNREEFEYKPCILKKDKSKE